MQLNSVLIPCFLFASVVLADLPRELHPSRLQTNRQGTSTVSNYAGVLLPYPYPDMSFNTIFTTVVVPEVSNLDGVGGAGVSFLVALGGCSSPSLSAGIYASNDNGVMEYKAGYQQQAQLNPSFLNIDVKPGDRINVNITLTPAYNITIENVTNGHQRTIQFVYFHDKPCAELAEWIVETNGPRALANFGEAQFVNTWGMGPGRRQFLPGEGRIYDISLNNRTLTRTTVSEATITVQHI